MDKYTYTYIVAVIATLGMIWALGIWTLGMWSIYTLSAMAVFSFVLGSALGVELLYRRELRKRGLL